jgi:hypothetical protein
MHHWYHVNNIKYPTISSICSSIHIYDSIVVLKKEKVFEPTHSRIS